MISGPPGRGKTTLALEIVRAVATGQRALDRFPARLGSCLIVEEEHHPGALAKKLKAHGLELPNVAIMHRKKLRIDQRHDDLHEYTPLDVVVDVARSGDVRLILLDPFTEMHEQDENSAREIGVALEGIRYIQEKVPTASIVVLHHTVKSGWDQKSNGLGSARGSGRIHGFFDIIYDVQGRAEKDSLDINVTCTKNRDFPAIAPFSVKALFNDAHSVRWLTAEPPVPLPVRIVTLVRQAGGAIRSKNELARQLSGVQKAEALAEVDRMVGAGELYLVRSGRAQEVHLARAMANGSGTDCGHGGTDGGLPRAAPGQDMALADPSVQVFIPKEPIDGTVAFSEGEASAP